MFGAPLEQTWGEKRFLLYYLVCVAGAGVCQLLVGTLLENPATVLGASGGVFGLLLAYRHAVPEPAGDAAVPADPDEGAHLRDPVWRGRTGAGHDRWQPGVAHFAHLGGMLFGWLLIRYWRGQPPFKRRPPGPPKRPNHLRSVK